MSSVPIQRRHLRLVPALPSSADDAIPEPEPALTIDCDACETVLDLTRAGAVPRTIRAPLGIA